MKDGSISSPFSYQALMETALWSMAKQYEREVYEKWISTYEQDACNRFLKSKETTAALIYKEGLIATLGIPYLVRNHSLTNVYKKYFKNTDTGQQFVSEKDLEYVLFDSLHYFDLGEAVIVKKQVSTNSGPVDLMIKHEDDVYLIELKKAKAKRKDVYQSLDYAKGYDASGHEKVHPILIAHEFDESILELAKENGVGCYRYIVGIDIPDTLIILESSVQNESFTKLYDYIVAETSHIIATLPEFLPSHNEKVVENMKKVIKAVEWISYCLEKYSKGA